jgi:hypothetical protein
MARLKFCLLNRFADAAAMILPLRGSTDAIAAVGPLVPKLRSTVCSASLCRRGRMVVLICSPPLKRLSSRSWTVAPKIGLAWNSRITSSMIAGCLLGFLRGVATLMLRDLNLSTCLSVR